jgi:hypothetical protein
MDPKFFAWAEPVEDSRVVSRFSALAGELGVVIPIPFFEKKDNEYYNSCAVADADGKISVHVPSTADASLSSGLSALKVERIGGDEKEMLSGTGAEIAQIAATNGGSITVAVSSRISIAPICLAYSQDSGKEVLWFRYTNRFGETLEVSDSGLNTLMSPSGLPYPISAFHSTDDTKPDWYLGYEWLLDYFKDVDPISNREIIRATWKLLGKEVSVAQPKEEIPLCSAGGGLSGCSRYSDTAISKIYQQALSTVVSLTKECEKAKRQGLWRPQGKFRAPFLGQSAKSLSAIKQVLTRLPTDRYLCDAYVPQGCTYVDYPYRELLGEYERIFTVKLPRGLKQIVRKYPAERRKFIAELNKQPKKLVACGR